ncbi:MAG: hypothetical protein ACLUHE_05435 [Christensenellales bacterium]
MTDQRVSAIKIATLVSCSATTVIEVYRARRRDAGDGPTEARWRLSLWLAGMAEADGRISKTLRRSALLRASIAEASSPDGDTRSIVRDWAAVGAVRKSG